ncbi:unnamed protein product [Kluyveromyces dobzhanskii CBS 2104]|uniref:WGS project CCBQ000000000 data, contig 00015 n=1 Tax=Kluyveromyces dobzhanskii CBS 2104 TaxID=1427455 RepID=A0A0A8LC59_9SACH|nr:unnamed protein product [Kluyveromyces dobzhanskii CBS 2104]
MIEGDVSGVEPVSSPNSLKRKPDHETLEAGIKRVALEDNDIEPISSELNGDGDGTHALEQDSKQVPNYINLRMLCLMKQASKVVGGKGERVNRIKAETNTRINVSDNINGVMERVIFVRGKCEEVARAFGKIVRAINNEGDNDSNERSLPLVVNLLIPHHFMGCVIGRQGSRLHEIEELSAARLMASPQQLPMSNDRILSLTGVADAIHIATYYIGETILENENKLKNKKSVFYHPGPMHSVLVNNYQMYMIYSGGALTNPQEIQPLVAPHQEHHQYHPFDKKTTNRRSKLPVAKYQGEQQPSLQPYSDIADSCKHIKIVSQLQQPPVSPHLVVPQEVFIDNKFVGNVIGKGGKNIQQIKQSTGCMIKINDPVEGLDERKLVLIGTPLATQTAIMMINNRIDMDKRKRQEAVLME